MRRLRRGWRSRSRFLPRSFAARHLAVWGECAGPVAQLDRASPSEGEGRTFESCRVRQYFQQVSACCPSGNRARDNSSRHRITRSAGAGAGNVSDDALLFALRSPVVRSCRRTQAPPSRRETSSRSRYPSPSASMGGSERTTRMRQWHRSLPVGGALEAVGIRGHALAAAGPAWGAGEPGRLAR